MTDEEKDMESNEPEQEPGAGDVGETPEQKSDERPEAEIAQAKALERRLRRKQYIVSETKEWAKSIVIAIVIAVVFKATVIQSYAVPTGSMMPTIMPNDRVFGNRFVFYFRDPKPGEVISFMPPESVGDRQKTRFGTFIPYLKRVIAVEGDIIEVRRGYVYVNDKKVDEPYIAEFPNYEMAPREVPKGMLFVLGDNRNNSKDSHIWGFLPKENVKAKAFFRYWPSDRIGVVK